MSATDRRSPLGVGPLVRGFVQGRWPTHGTGWDRKAALGRADRHRRVNRGLGERCGLRQIVTAYTPVGPTAEALGDLRTALAEHDIAVRPVMRDFDQSAWQHATRGFFQFREKIRWFLAQLGVGENRYNLNEWWLGRANTSA